MKIAMASKTYMLLGAVLLAQFVPVAAMAEGRCPRASIRLAVRAWAAALPFLARVSQEAMSRPQEDGKHDGARSQVMLATTRVKMPQLEWLSRKLLKLKRGE